MGKYMWSTSVPLRSLKCIMAQTFLLSFPCTWFLLFFLSIYLILLIFSPSCSQNETEHEIFQHLISCSNYLYSLLFNLFSSSIYFLQSPKIYVSSLFFSICTALAHWSQACLSSCLESWKSHFNDSLYFHSCSVLISSLHSSQNAF